MISSRGPTFAGEAKISAQVAHVLSGSAGFQPALANRFLEKSVEPRGSRASGCSTMRYGWALNRAVLFLLLSIFSITLLAPSGWCGTADNTTATSPKIDEDFVVGKVTSVTQTSVDQQLLHKTGILSRSQLVDVEIKEGPLTGQHVKVGNEMTDNPAYNIAVKPGQELILSVVTENGIKPEVNISDYRRSPILLALFAVFLGAFMFFGGKQGIKSLAGLLFCVGLIVLVLLPLSLRGFNPLVTSIFICLAATAASMFFVAGFSAKAFSAIIGTVGGVIIAGIAAQTVIVLAPLTGLSSEEAQILRGSVLVQPPEFYSGLLTAGMLIGALGVIMDVGISIASAVWEVSKTDEKLSADELYSSGMNVGRDIMGTMTNTLVLAYAGSALPLLLLVAHMPSIKLLNLDLVATEVTAALTGSLGLICTIPLTAFAAAKIMSRGKPERKENSKNRSIHEYGTIESLQKMNSGLHDNLLEPDVDSAGRTRS